MSIWSSTASGAHAQGGNWVKAVEWREAFALTVTIMVSLVPLLASSGCEEHAGAAARPVEEERLRIVEVHRVTSHIIQDRVEISANIVPRRQVKIVPRVPGRIEKVLVDEGDRVEEGQVVAQLDRRDYLLNLQQAEAQLAAARANAKLASVGVNSASIQQQRMQQLHETDAISQSELDRVNDGHEMGLAKQTAAQAQAKLASVGLDSARTKLADTVLRAPFSGLVVSRLLDEGELCGLMPPGIVMIIADVDAMEVTGSVSELKVSKITAGMPATVHVDAVPDAAFAGNVEVVSPMVDPRTRTSEVRVIVPNPEGRLEMGMSAEIELDLGQREVTAIPDDVLIRSGDDRERAHLFVVSGDIARRREVVLGERQGDVIEVRDGLRVGELVVRAGQSGLRDGQRVEVRESRVESSARSSAVE